LTIATESSVQLVLESGTICGQMSDSRTSHAAAVVSLKTFSFWRWNHSWVWTHV